MPTVKSYRRYYLKLNFPINFFLNCFKIPETLKALFLHPMLDLQWLGEVNKVAPPPANKYINKHLHSKFRKSTKFCMFDFILQNRERQAEKSDFTSAYMETKSTHKQQVKWQPGVLRVKHKICSHEE